jgi:hypothetical protein
VTHNTTGIEILVGTVIHIGIRDTTEDAPVLCHAHNGGLPLPRLPMTDRRPSVCRSGDAERCRAIRLLRHSVAETVRRPTPGAVMPRLLPLAPSAVAYA